MSDQTPPTIPKPRSMAQMEALQRARLKAQEVRRANADLKAKQKTILQAEKDQAAAEINKKFQEITQAVPEQSETPPEPPPETPVATEEEVEEVEQKKKKKKKRVVVVQESSSDEEYEIVLPKEKKKRSQEESPPIPQPQNPFERPFMPMMFPY